MPAKIRDSDGGWFMVGDRLARVQGDGALCTIPYVVGTLFGNTPSSPLYFDSAAHLRSLMIETPGVLTVRFWRSLTPDDPVNQAEIDTAIDAGNPIPTPDMSNHKWIRLTSIRGMDFHGPGFEEVPQEILQAAKLSRWLKVDPIHGPITTSKFHPTVAGF